MTRLMKDGDAPDVFRGVVEKGAGFTVTSEIPGTRGPKCLKCTDRKGLSKLKCQNAIARRR